MNQSSTSVGINLRNKGLRNTSGNLIKGCVKDATSKLSIGSIPSNYQTIIYHTQSTKAFGTSQKRFYQQTKNDLQKTDIPTQSILTESNLKKNVSHSTKGYGPLIAKQQRNWIFKNQAPGPGRYQSSKTAQPQIKRKKRHCLTRQRKQNVQNVQKNKKLQQLPGPGQYYIFQQRNGNNGWKSSFKSRLDRNGYLPNSNTPGPGHYDVKLAKHIKSIIQQKSRQSLLNQKQKQNSPNKTLNLFYKPVSEDLFPGPGSYQYQLPTFKPLYERIKISGNFIINKKDRFNNYVDKFQHGDDENIENKPDIYTYEIKSGFNDQKRLIKWPCFMSESKRMVFSGQKKLGPSFITPSLQNRKNFHLNIKGSWF